MLSGIHGGEYLVGWFVLCYIGMFVYLFLTRGKPDKEREPYVLLFSVLAITGVVFGAYSQRFFEPSVTDEFTVFDSFIEESGNTLVLTYGDGKRIFLGEHVFEPEATYRVVWRFTQQSNQKYGINVKITSIEKIEGEYDDTN